MKRRTPRPRSGDLVAGRREPRCAGNTILIVTEGAKSEPNYFREVLRKLRLHSAQVEVVHPKATDPVNLVDHAIDLKNKREREAKKGGDPKWDEVWVVFDHEQIHSGRAQPINDATQRAKSEGIRVALSNPCFEFWLLLHFVYTTRAFADCGAVVKELRDHWTGYSKSSPPGDATLNRIPSAVKHARQCRAHHLESNGDGNPSTDVDLLVEGLNAATREHLRLSLT